MNSCKFVSESELPTKFGDFTISAFEEPNGKDHIALTVGDIHNQDSVMCRVHSECLTGDALQSLRCDCGAQLDAAMRQIQEVGWGCIVYLRQEGRGIGLHAKIQAYNLQDRGADTLDANLMLGHPVDNRDYRVASEILSSLKVENVCLLTNNPDKILQLQELGINIVERMPIIVGVGRENRDYLITKVDRMGHDIDSDILNGGD